MMTRKEIEEIGDEMNYEGHCPKHCNEFYVHEPVKEIILGLCFAFLIIPILAILTPLAMIRSYYVEPEKQEK